MSVFLRVTYTVRVNHFEAFERTLLGEVVPIALELGIHYVGAWKTIVGKIGEYMELWQFESMADFEKNWRRLLEHPQMQTVFESTGSIVDVERFELIEPLGKPDSAKKERFKI